MLKPTKLQCVILQLQLQALPPLKRRFAIVLGGFRAKHMPLVKGRMVALSLSQTFKLFPGGVCTPPPPRVRPKNYPTPMCKKTILVFF